MIKSVVCRLSDLKIFPQWVCYTHDSKKPINPHTGYGADCNKSETWGSYERARLVWAGNKDKYAGLGFEFVKEQEITGIDLDKCVIDGKLTKFAKEILARLDSYAEYSPSGMGIHIWVRGSIPNNLKAEGDIRIEMYDHQRYFTVTGKHVHGTPETIEDRQEELTALHQEMLALRTETKNSKPRRNTDPLPRSNRLDLNLNFYGTRYGVKALEEECIDMAMAMEGARNEQLNRSAFAAGQLLSGGELRDRSYIERELGAAAQAAGLPDREIETTLRSGIEAGMREPRSAPPRPSYVTGEDYAQQEEDQEEPKASEQEEAPGLTPADLCRFTEDDAGNGDAMYALYGHNFLYCPSRGWFRYTGTHWELDPDGASVKKCAVKTLRTRRHAAVELGAELIVKCTKGDESRVNGCVNRFRTLVTVSIDEFDRHPDVLNCKNGVVNLRTGNIEEHSREQRFTYCVPVCYRPCHSQDLLDYIHGVVGGGQEVVDYLQMALGYSLTGHTREEILFYLYGPPRSGKGTLAEIFMKLLPDPISTMVDFNSFTAKREGDVSNFDLAPLKPSRMIFASESQKSQSLNPAKIKQLTGGDQVRACYKHRDFFSYRPQFKVWMMSNHPVNGDPEDDALWGRVRVIEFPNSYLGSEDKTKKERMKSDECLEAALYWSVQGAIKWYSLGATGLTTPDVVAETTKKQREELDYVQQWLDEMCQEDKQAWEPNDAVTASYLRWCENNNIQYPKGPKALAQSLKAKGYEVGVAKWEDGKTRRGVSGLRVFNS